MGFGYHKSLFRIFFFTAIFLLFKLTTSNALMNSSSGGCPDPCTEDSECAIPGKPGVGACIDWCCGMVTKRSKKGQISVKDHSIKTKAEQTLPEEEPCANGYEYREDPYLTTLNEFCANNAKYGEPTDEQILSACKEKIYPCQDYQEVGFKIYGCFISTQNAESALSDFSQVCQQGASAVINFDYWDISGPVDNEIDLGQLICCKKSSVSPTEFNPDAEVVSEPDLDGSTLKEQQPAGRR